MANAALTHIRTLYVVIFEKMRAAIRARDVEAFAPLYYAKFEMKMHSNGTFATE